MYLVVSGIQKTENTGNTKNTRETTAIHRWLTSFSVFELEGGGEGLI